MVVGLNIDPFLVSMAFNYFKVRAVKIVKLTLVWRNLHLDNGEQLNTLVSLSMLTKNAFSLVKKKNALVKQNFHSGLSDEDIYKASP